MPDLPGWEPDRPSVLARHAALRRVVAFVAAELYRAYFRYRWARSLLDRAGLVHFFLQSPYFRLPSAEARQALLSAVGTGRWPRLQSGLPVLVECWRQGSTDQLHLVNYADAPQLVRLDLGESKRGRILTPDGEEIEFQGESLKLMLDVYLVIQAGTPAGRQV